MKSYEKRELARAAHVNRTWLAERLAARQSRSGAPAAAAGGAKGEEEDEADMAEQRELEGEALHEGEADMRPCGFRKEGEADIGCCRL